MQYTPDRLNKFFISSQQPAISELFYKPRSSLTTHVDRFNLSSYCQVWTAATGAHQARISISKTIRLNRQAEDAGRAARAALGGGGCAAAWLLKDPDSPPLPQRRAGAAASEQAARCRQPRPAPGRRMCCARPAPAAGQVRGPHIQRRLICGVLGCLRQAGLRAHARS